MKSTLRRILWIIIVLAACPAAIAWYWVTQPALPWQSDGRIPLPQADAELLKRHVKVISQDIFPRDHTHPQNLDRAAEYIRATWAAQGIAVRDQTYVVAGITYRNVIADLGPETKERIVIGAHYDSYGELPAADDNASGAAGLIELARLLRGQTLRHRVELVAYTLEEPPHFRTPNMGSAQHAKSLAASGARARLMVSLEGIGYFSDAPNSQRYPLRAMDLAYPSTGNFIAVIGRFDDSRAARLVRDAMRSASPLPVLSANAPDWVPGVDFSDHLNYWNEGFAAVMVTNTAFYRNKAYHTPQDTADRLDYKRMGYVVDGVAAAVVKADGLVDL
jgi:hypothetical protein